MKCLLVFLSLGLFSCGQSTQLIGMQAAPATPFVLDQDFTDTSESAAVSYTANLIAFRFNIRNDHAELVTVLGVRFTVTSLISGEEKIINVPVEKIVGGITAGLKELNPGEKLVPDGDSEDENSAAKLVYLDGLPKDEGAKRFRYRIKAEIQGWVGSKISPKGRLSSTYSFTTLE